jgi:hypothetical protein
VKKQPIITTASTLNIPSAVPGVRYKLPPRSKISYRIPLHPPRPRDKR